MLLMSWFGWWYGRGWLELIAGLKARLGKVYLDFSVPLLLQTLLSPWRRIVTHKEGSLEQRFRAVIDNAVSRAVGFGVRLSALIAALALMLAIGVGGLLLVIAWPFIPVAGVVFMVIGLAK